MSQRARPRPRAAGRSDAPEDPPGGSPAELDAFARLQAGLATALRPRHGRARTTVVVPSLSLPASQLAEIPGVLSFEERLLCLLEALRDPDVRMVVVTSTRLDRVLVDYHLDLVAPGHAAALRRRLTLLDCGDGSFAPLTEKLLARPRLLEAVRGAMGPPGHAHLECFNSSPLERTLAVRLGIALHACDPALLTLGHKSGCRKVFRAAGVPMPDGAEDLRTEADVLDALGDLRGRDRGLRRAVLKLDDSFGGVGNAVLDLPASGDRAAMATALRNAHFSAPEQHLEGFLDELGHMGGIVEAFVDGGVGRSPSAQCVVEPGRVRVVATHEQVLAGDLGHVFTGCTFPALSAYRRRLQDVARAVAGELAGRGVTGPLSVDFVCRRRNGAWDVYAIEVNLRHGGTTAPLHLLRALTGAEYDEDGAECLDRSGRPVHYRASDRVHDPSLCRLDAGAAVGALRDAHLHQHDDPLARGSALYMLGALPAHGRLGVMSVGGSASAATRLFDRTTAALVAAAQAADGRPGAPRPRASEGVVDLADHLAEAGASV